MTGYNGHMSQLSILAEELGVSERTLRRAANQGAIRASRPTPRRTALTVTERHYLRRSWPLLSALRRTLRTEQNVRFAMLFGSAALGSDGSGSDVDILVDLRKDDLETVTDLSSKLTDAVGRPVEVVRLSDAAEDELFLAGILSEGRVLVDRDELWPGLMQRVEPLVRRGRRHQAKRLEAVFTGVERMARM